MSWLGHAGRFITAGLVTAFLLMVSPASGHASAFADAPLVDKVSSVSAADSAQLVTVQIGIATADRTPSTRPITVSTITASVALDQSLVTACDVVHRRRLQAFGNHSLSGSTIPTLLDLGILLRQ